MKLFNRISRRVAGGLVLAAVFAAVPAIIRADGTNSVAAAAKPVPYPLKTCVVSGDKLGGDMGVPIEFIYQTNGINQEIKFCCPMCKPTFMSDPDKYLKIIQAAEAEAKAKDAKK
jgi:YHS domain-containing protein